MKHFLIVAIITAVAAPAVAGDVSVSIGVSQPGFFGQINIGGIPRPPVIYAQPVVSPGAPIVVGAEPIYLHVPAGHEKHWRKHCAEYHACGRPVYFVRDDWYQKEYAPRHHDHDADHADYRRHDRDHEHGHDDGHDRDR